MEQLSERGHCVTRMCRRSSLKVVHLVATNQGGAYRAAFRIAKAVNEVNDIESQFVTAADCRMNMLDKIVYKIKHKIYSYILPKRGKTGYFFSTDLEALPLMKLEAIQQADVIHLHWVAGLLNIKTLQKIIRMGKPIVWTLHDMHPFTGGCHYDDECGRYVNSCGECKQIASHKAKDFSNWNLRKKRAVLRKAIMTVVGCSRWITECAGKSAVMKDFSCVTIPNCVDTEIYKPCDRRYARERLGIDFGDRKVVAFGAMNSTSDKRKGFAYLDEALKKLDPVKYACVIFGGTSDNVNSHIPVKNIEYLQDDYSLALLYSAADVFVAPSLQENLANTVMESLACGTPVVAFDVGGMKDMIEHEYSGYLAQKFDTEDLARGICVCCQHAEWGINGREKVLEKYTPDRISSEYVKIYKMLCGM